MQGLTVVQAIGWLSFLLAVYLLKNLHKQYNEFQKSVVEDLHRLHERMTRVEVASGFVPEQRERQEAYYPSPERRGLRWPKR